MKERNNGRERKIDREERADRGKEGKLEGEWEKK